jgi:hypothetical protein
MNAIASRPSALNSIFRGNRADIKKGWNMLRTIWMSVFMLIGMVFSLDARADYWFKVNDASQIQYLIGQTQIYLRNLNSFDASVQGTAPWSDYNYWIDLSTDVGKACWATLLAKMEAREPIWIYITSQTANGAVTIAWFG